MPFCSVRPLGFAIGWREREKETVLSIVQSKMKVQGRGAGREGEQEGKRK